MNLKEFVLNLEGSKVTSTSWINTNLKLSLKDEAAEPKKNGSCLANERAVLEGSLGKKEKQPPLGRDFSFRLERHT